MPIKSYLAHPHKGKKEELIDKDEDMPKFIRKKIKTA